MSARRRTTLLGHLVPALVLLVGFGSAYLLSRASAGALAAASRLLVTAGIGGLAFVALVVAVQLHRARRGNGGDDGRGGSRRPDMPPGRSPGPFDDLDIELFELLGDEPRRSPDAPLDPGHQPRRTRARPGPASEAGALYD